MQTLLLDIDLSRKQIDTLKEALNASNKDNVLIFKTNDGSYYQITGRIKKVAKP